MLASPSARASRSKVSSSILADIPFYGRGLRHVPSQVGVEQFGSFFSHTPQQILTSPVKQCSPIGRQGSRHKPRTLLPAGPHTNGLQQGTFAEQHGMSPGEPGPHRSSRWGVRVVQQMPALHVENPWQRCPHAPQFLSSNCRFEQFPLQQVFGAAPHVPHVPSQPLSPQSLFRQFGVHVQIPSVQTSLANWHVAQLIPPVPHAVLAVPG